MRLDPDRFVQVVRDSPLVSIDLVIRNPRDEVLLGLRNNPPARDSWFVPGGRICKDERLDAAFRRIAMDELGTPLGRDEARFLGVYEHLYADNFADRPGFGTHYVVLGYEVRLGDPAPPLPADQHREYRWMAEAELLAASDVHPHTKAYFPHGRTAG